MKSNLKHLSHNPLAGIRVQCNGGLVEEPVGTGTSRMPGRIKPHTPFTDPREETSNLGSKFHSSMRHPGPWFKHNAGNTTDGDLNPHPPDVNQDKGTIQDIEFSIFKKNE